MSSASGGLDWDPDDGSKYRRLADCTGFPEISSYPTKRNRKNAMTLKLPTQIQQYAEFYIMSHAVDGQNLKMASPFVIETSIRQSIGEGSITKRLRDGTLLIKCKNEKQAKQLTTMKSLGGQYDVKIEEHKTLNHSKGIIYCYDLKFLSEEEIKEGLQSQKVTEVKKMKKKKNGELVDTGLCIITFKLPSIPEAIKVGFHHVLVNHYIPNPLRCLNCFKYGHPKKYCDSERVCALCSQTYHEGDCSTGNKCVNCSESHTNWNKECSKYKMESEIQKIVVMDKISNFEARKKLIRNFPNFDVTYPTYASKLNGIGFKTTTNEETAIMDNRILNSPHHSPKIIPQASNITKQSLPNEKYDLNYRSNSKYNNALQTDNETNQTKDIKVTTLTSNNETNTTTTSTPKINENDKNTIITQKPDTLMETEELK